MKTMTTMISKSDKDSFLPDCEPGEMVNITGTLGEPDAAGNYPVAVENCSVTESETEPEEEIPPAPPPKPKKASVQAVLQEEE